MSFSQDVKFVLLNSYQKKSNSPPMKALTVEQVRVLARVAGVPFKVAHDTLKRHHILIDDGEWAIV